MLGLHTGCVGSIFITGIFTVSGWEFVTFRTGIPGGLVSKILPFSHARANCVSKLVSARIMHQHVHLTDIMHPTTVHGVGY